MSHPPAYDSYIGYPKPEINWDTTNGSWVGIGGGKYDWGDQIGNDVLHENDEFEFEVWQPDLRADKVYQHKFDNGLIHKLFPAYNNNAHIKNVTVSDKIIEAIEVEISNNQIILHVDVRVIMVAKIIILMHVKETKLGIVFSNVYAKRQ